MTVDLLCTIPSRSSLTIESSGESRIDETSFSVFVPFVAAEQGDDGSMVTRDAVVWRYQVTEGNGLPGRAKRYPWSRSQPAATMASRSAVLSMPSAITIIPSSWKSDVID
jgi:hypothetical protein